MTDTSELGQQTLVPGWTRTGPASVEMEPGLWPSTEFAMVRNQPHLATLGYLCDEEGTQVIFMGGGCRCSRLASRVGEL